jgi:hypothetical protein
MAYIHDGMRLSVISCRARRQKQTAQRRDAYEVAVGTNGQVLELQHAVDIVRRDVIHSRIAHTQNCATDVHSRADNIAGQTRLPSARCTRTHTRARTSIHSTGHDHCGLSGVAHNPLAIHTHPPALAWPLRTDTHDLASQGSNTSDTHAHAQRWCVCVCRADQVSKRAVITSAPPK